MIRTGKLLCLALSKLGSTSSCFGYQLKIHLLCEGGKDNVMLLSSLLQKKYFVPLQPPASRREMLWTSNCQRNAFVWLVHQGRRNGVP